MAQMRDERGLALVVAVLATTLLMAIGLALALTASIELGVAANQVAANASLYAADAGLERALEELLPLADWSPVLQGIQSSSCVDGPLGTPRRLGDGASIDPSEVANIANCAHSTPCSAAELDLQTQDRPWGPNNPRWQVYAHGPLSTFTEGATADPSMYVVVLVADDPSETDGNPALDGAAGNPGAGIIFARAESFGAAGAHAIVEATLVRTDTDARARATSWRAIR